jgi:broad specificity phosphatase PhoE
MTLVRHGFSEFNENQEIKDRDPDYQLLKRRQDRNDALFDPISAETQRLAKKLARRYPYDTPDDKIPLANHGAWQAKQTGAALAQVVDLPHAILCGPSLRHKMTLSALSRGWPALKGVRTIYENLLREQSHGDAEKYGDHRIFLALNPVEAAKKKEGDLSYRYPGGQSVEDKTIELGCFLSMLRSDFGNQKVLVISSKLNVAIIRMILERLTPEQYNKINVEAGAKNCGVTIYLRAIVDQQPQLLLKQYNVTYY